MAKIKKDQIIATTIRLPEKLHKEIAVRAETSYRSISQYVEMVLQTHVEDFCRECGNIYGSGYRPEHGQTCQTCEQFQKDQKIECEINETIEGR
jgi:hypothetical protein